jgi:hypothetical protein
MRKPSRFLPALVAGVASAIIAASPAFATLITYTEQATATGSLNGIAFTNAVVLLTMNGDTTNVVETEPALFKNAGTVTVSVGGGAPVTFTGSLGVFSQQDQGGAVGFQNNTIQGDILDNVSPSFVTYDLTTSIGPISGTATFNPGFPFPTTGGDFILDSVAGPTSTFIATTSTAAPEPASLALLGVALAGLGIIIHRRKGADEWRGA